MCLLQVVCYPCLPCRACPANDIRRGEGHTGNWFCRNLVLMSNFPRAYYSGHSLSALKYLDNHSFASLARPLLLHRIFFAIFFVPLPFLQQSSSWVSFASSSSSTFCASSSPQLRYLGRRENISNRSQKTTSAESQYEHHERPHKQVKDSSANRNMAGDF